MKIMAFNGSPRKKWNTATLLEKALEGAAQAGAETELVHLYGLEFSGCLSCFSCKKIDGPSYGRCALKDQLRPVLEKANLADGLILGTPVYFGAETGRMRQFMERLLFPNLRYAADDRSLFPRKIKTGLIYTMNVKEEAIPNFGWDRVFANTQRVLDLIFGSAELLLCTDTMQFKDYTLYDAPMFDQEQKKRRYDEVFPKDCRRAFELGRRVAGR